MIFSLIPLYLLGNFHCMGMCGPLVMLLAKHPYRWFYFVGRITSFSLAALLAAEVGFFFSSPYFALAIGLAICSMGLLLLFSLSFPGGHWIAKKTARISAIFSKLILIDHPMTTFLFGFCTVFLPCGQSLIVFSACALAPNPLIGLLNGFLFALLTSPSLVAALYATTLFKRWRGNYHLLMGSFTLVVGALAFLRGLANLNVIPHLSFSHHIVLY